MTLLALIGAKALYLLFSWLLSAAIAASVADRKGYGEKMGLTLGLLLSAIGLVIVLLLPGRPGSRWKLDGPIPPKFRERLAALNPVRAIRARRASRPRA